MVEFLHCNKCNHRSIEKLAHYILMILNFQCRTVMTIPWRYLFPFPADPLWASVPIWTSYCPPSLFPWHCLSIPSPLFSEPQCFHTIVSHNLLCFLYIRTMHATWRHSFNLLSPGKPSCTSLVDAHSIQLVSSPDHWALLRSCCTSARWRPCLPHDSSRSLNDQS